MSPARYVSVSITSRAARNAAFTMGEILAIIFGVSRLLTDRGFKWDEILTQLC